MGLSLGNDIGGTFTDFVLVDGDTGDFRIHKRIFWHKALHADIPVLEIMLSLFLGQHARRV